MRPILALALVCFVALGARWWAATGEPPVDPIVFEDVAAPAGVDFVVRNSVSPNKHQPETMIAGVAVFDYNHDGRPDIYFVNGATMPGLEKTDPSFHNGLYRNNGDGTFSNVTAQAGVAGIGYGMGAAAGDYDNDGNADLFLPGLNPNLLYRNRGDGAFEDATQRAGLEGIDPQRGKPWAIAAGWFDYDADGWLDLFVVNYCVWKPETEPFCGDRAAGYRTYCHPKYYDALPNSLYHNDGDGTFTDVSRPSGIADHLGKGMGVAFADYDGDGDLDVFVANDTTPNFLFRNDGRGRFTEAAVRAGVAYNDDGRAVSSMGADFRDYDNDGRPDVFVAALANETFPLFRNIGRGFFTDVTYRSRIGGFTLAASGWSNGIYDFNNDGYKDLFAAAGDVQDNTELFSSRKSRQPNVMLVNMKNGTFAAAGVSSPALHRGVAFGDFNLDGRVDAVVTRLSARSFFKIRRRRRTTGWPCGWPAATATATGSARGSVW
jgi:hypothetical protein